MTNHSFLYGRLLPHSDKKDFVAATGLEPVTFRE